jgi:hypothetical protein
MKVFLKDNESKNEWKNNYYLLEDPDELGLNEREIKLEPHIGEISFVVNLSDLKYFYGLKTDLVSLQLDDVDSSVEPEKKTIECLVGLMDITSKEKLSFIDTHRIIDTFKIIISSSDKEINEFIGHSESEHSPHDEMTLHVSVSDEKFSKIKKITEIQSTKKSIFDKRKNFKIEIVTSGVSGLYSEWIPPLTDDMERVDDPKYVYYKTFLNNYDMKLLNYLKYIMVLNQDYDVKISEYSEINPFRLGNIQRCVLTIIEE